MQTQRKYDRLRIRGSSKGDVPVSTGRKQKTEGQAVRRRLRGADSSENQLVNQL